MKLNLRLLEAINYNNYSNKLEPDLYNFFLSLDPTKEKKYAQWIIRSFFRKHGEELEKEMEKAQLGKNTSDAKSGNRFFYSYPLSIEKIAFLVHYYTFNNPYSNSVLNDFFHDPQTITRYQNLFKHYDLLKNKNKLKPEEKNIMNFTNFSALFGLMADYKEVLLSLEDENIDKSEYTKWYEDKTWLVVIPLTHKASCKYGANSKWCTASRDSAYNFNNYRSRGKLIIIINKETNNKWQLFLESGEWNDETNSPVDREKFLALLPKEVKRAIYQKTNKIEFNPDLEVLLKKAIEDESFILKMRSYEEIGKDIKYLIENGKYKLHSEYLMNALINSDDYSELNDSDAYQYGYDRPWYFTSDLPALASSISEEERKNNREWKENEELWSEEQKEEAGNNSESEAISEWLSDLHHELMRGITGKRGGSIDYTDILHQYFVELLNHPENVFTFLMMGVGLDDSEYNLPRYLARELNHLEDRQKNSPE